MQRSHFIVVCRTDDPNRLAEPNPIFANVAIDDAVGRTLVFSNVDENRGSLLAFLEGIDPKQMWFSAKEVAAILGRTDQFVRDLLENRRLFGHALCGRGESSRRSYQIHRTAIELYLLETANYSPDDYGKKLIRLIKSLPRQEQEKIAQSFGQHDRSPYA